MKLASTDPTVSSVILAITAGPDLVEDGQEVAGAGLYQVVTGPNMPRPATAHPLYYVDSGPDLQTQFSDVFTTIANSVAGEASGAYIKFYSLSRDIGPGPRAGLQGKFAVEESLRSRLKVVLNTKFKEDIEKFELVSPSGVRHQVLNFCGLSFPNDCSFGFFEPSQGTS